MKLTRVITLISFVITGMAIQPVVAQQEAQLTQFMFNRLYYNPAYAGAEGKACGSALYRRQWLGLEGAPESQLVSFHTPLFQERVGLGLNLNRQSIGISRALTAEMSYAYRLPLGPGYLSAGLSASVRYFTEDYSDSRIIASQDINYDPGVPMGQQSKYLPNFGVGMYYQAKRWYAGIGMPRLIESSIDFAAGGGQAREIRHLYAMGGYKIPITSMLNVHPQVLFKYLDGAPFDGDISVLLEMERQFHAGISYRLGGNMERNGGESIDLLLGFWIQKQMLIGVAYDISMSKIRTYQSGTFEVMLQYCFGNRGVTTIDNPRFFE
jgi:type IX secretion system PorP/SprF family membrane protein